MTYGGARCAHLDLPLTVMRCGSFLERARGLLLRPPLLDAQALLIAPCSSVHMIGMRYAIDVAFVDAEDIVITVRHALPPFAIASARGARAAWEFTAGTCARLTIAPGSHLTFVPN